MPASRSSHCTHIVAPFEFHVTFLATAAIFLAITTPSTISKEIAFTCNRKTLAGYNKGQAR